MEHVYGVWAVRSAASMFGHAEAWCKEDGRPLEFESLETAQAYALELNRKTTANVRYFVKEKEPEPNAVRVPASQPDMEAVGPVDRTPKNDVAEKHNEIPGRQMAPEADPVVEIRSAVHSNYANMVAILAADNKVYLGREERYSFIPGQPGSYDNRDGSLCFVSDMPEMYYFLYGEGWSHSQEEMLDRGLTMDQYMEFARLREGVLQQFTPRREILFAGQPFQAPENYLRNAELDLEGEKGNYNMIDGIVNNDPPVRADLTDGQTHEEVKELAPETLPNEKPSIMEKLRADRMEHEARGFQPSPPERGL
ncbi:MAG: DUF4316 domain-containing protein [Clostridiales bacterium]|nr:DUF4316 domain-containing protein [Clostridiales bacterium]